jgi:hypothetical protein
MFNSMKFRLKGRSKGRRSKCTRRDWWITSKKRYNRRKTIKFRRRSTISR